MTARANGSSGFYIFGARKAGLVVITRSLAKIAAPDHVRVNATLASNTESPMLGHGVSQEVFDQMQD